MLNQSELEKLRGYDADKLASVIGATCRMPGGAERAVWAASYVLMRSLEDYKISIDTMDLYFSSTSEKPSRELYIKKALAQCWDNIRELKYRYTVDEFKAVLLFYNGDGIRGWDVPTPDGVAKLAARLIKAEPGLVAFSESAMPWSRRLRTQDWRLTLNLQL